MLAQAFTARRHACAIYAIWLGVLCSLSVRLLRHKPVFCQNGLTRQIIKILQFSARCKDLGFRASSILIKYPNRSCQVAAYR